LLLASFAANAQIQGSQHDLTPAGSSQGSGATDQVCVFCHTPHGADVNAPVPLWNKVLNTAQSYTRYSSLATPTFDSLEAPVGSVSLACLSCHDGTQAMDVVINSPGSGGYDPTGVSIGGVGIMTGSPVPMLGTDLSNDHPISMQYGGGGLTDGNSGTGGQVPTGLLGDPDFVDPIFAVINGQPIWWVDALGTTGTGTREKTDMLLYTRIPVDTGLADTQPFVECGSCHDPHNSSTKPLGQVAFLRVSNAQSNVCRSCHTK
jgi:predicted CXXCH cytochrome family protein